MKAILALLVASTGCVAIPEGADHDDSSTSPTTPTGPAPVASGAYHVHSNIDLTVEALLPQPAEDAVVTLRNFSTKPGSTLLDLAGGAGVPAVQEIRDDLPDYVEDKLVGWLDSEIAKLTINGTPITQLAGTTAALAETALTQFAIDSTLAIDHGTATHELATLDLTPTGLDATFALSELPADLRSQTTTCTSSKGTLAIGDHTYALPYGEYIWTAINQQMTAQYGTDLRGVLGTAVNCPSLAHTIANKCIWGYCVGHETQLTEICEAGLDEAVAQLHAKLAEERIDALHFASGTAKLVDDDHDGIADRLDGGVWNAEINAGLGLRPVPATFTASR